MILWYAIVPDIEMPVYAGGMILKRPLGFNGSRIATTPGLPAAPPDPDDPPPVPPMPNEYAPADGDPHDDPPPPPPVDELIPAPYCSEFCLRYG